MGGTALNSTFTPSEVHSLSFVMSPSLQQVRIISSDILSPSFLAAELVVEAEMVMLATLVALVELLFVSAVLCIMYCVGSEHAYVAVECCSRGISEQGKKTCSDA
jgi:hypothetical protein